MNLPEAISQLIFDTKGGPGAGLFAPTSSLGLFLPEIVLCVTIVAMLFVRLFAWGQRLNVFWIALVGSGYGLFLAAMQSPDTSERVEIFTGMLVYDTFTVYMRCILLFFAVAFLILTRLSGIPDREDGPDIYSLVLGATLGMCLMASANHLLMVFMSVEMASVPSYALAGMLKGRRKGSEAALKYSVFGAGAAGVMLYGISLIAGLVNTAHLPSIARELSVLLPTMSGDELMVLALGGLMVMVGLAFKLSAVPFHFWCPDVFEGATAEVNAFLSVASKAAALALLIRVAIGFTLIVPEGGRAGEEAEITVAARAATSSGEEQRAFFAVEDHVPAAASHEATDHHVAAHPVVGDAAKNLRTVQGLMAKLIALLAVVTCTFGNLAAYGQTNIKRLLAYSTIAHAGYMMMAVPPVIAMANEHPASAEQAVAGLSIYIAVYLFMNLGAFAVVAFLRNEMRSEEIADYAGLIRHCPGIVICFALILFSLIGLPPLSGFIGKFAIFASLAEGYRLTSANYLLVLLIVGGVNTAISLFYYLRVVKVMTIDPDSETRGAVALPLISMPGLYLIVITIPTVVLLFGWDSLSRWAQFAASQLLG